MKQLPPFIEEEPLQEEDEEDLMRKALEISK